MVELDGRTVILTEGETISIPKKTKHRASALDSECVILEIAYGKFEENDIVRLEDDYNREGAPKTRVTAA